MRTGGMKFFNKVRSNCAAFSVSNFFCNTQDIQSYHDHLDESLGVSSQEFDQSYCRKLRLLDQKIKPTPRRASFQNFKVSISCGFLKTGTNNVVAGIKPKMVNSARKKPDARSACYHLTVDRHHRQYLYAQILQAYATSKVRIFFVI